MVFWVGVVCVFLFNAFVLFLLFIYFLFLVFIFFPLKEREGGNINLWKWLSHVCISVFSPSLCWGVFQPLSRCFSVHDKSVYYQIPNPGVQKTQCYPCPHRNHFRRWEFRHEFFYSRQVFKDCAGDLGEPARLSSVSGEHHNVVPGVSTLVFLFDFPHFFPKSSSKWKTLRIKIPHFFIFSFNNLLWFDLLISGEISLTSHHLLNN